MVNKWMAKFRNSLELWQWIVSTIEIFQNPRERERMVKLETVAYTGNITGQNYYRRSNPSFPFYQRYRLFNKDFTVCPLAVVLYDQGQQRTTCVSIKNFSICQVRGNALMSRLKDVVIPLVDNISKWNKIGGLYKWKLGIHTCMWIIEVYVAYMNNTHTLTFIFI